MKATFTLIALLMCLASQAESLDAYVAGILVNGKERFLQRNTLEIEQAEHLLLILKKPPKGLRYNITLEDEFIRFYIDSLHVLINPSKVRDYQLSISLLPSNSKFREVSLNIKVSKRKSLRFIPSLSIYILLLFSASIISLSFIHRRNKEKLIDLRNGWTNQLHNDIGGDLSSVSKRLEILQRKLSKVDEKVFENLNKTFLILRDIQKKLRFVFNLVDPKKDTLMVMFSGLYDFAIDNCNFQGIRFLYQNSLKEDDYKLDVGRVNKIYLVLKEGLNNAFKSAQAQHISLKVEARQQGIWVELKDDGIGFDLGREYGGNGLKNIRQDAKDGFMDIDIQSAPGLGTCITLFIFAKRNKKPPVLGVWAPKTGDYIWQQNA